MATPSAQGSIPRGPGPGYIEQSDDNTAAGDDPIVKEAKDRFQHCSKWEHNARQYFLDDIKFAHADAYNGYQWPNDIRRNRDVEEKPVLTINKVRQHNLQIINDAKKNKPGIKCYPVGNGATAESAGAIQALFRHIEYRSNATTAYGTAAAFQVNGGIGYIRVGTEYVDEKSFDQEIKIWRVLDPLTVFLDPEAKEEDKSDSRYGFIFDDILKDEFDKQYPEWADVATAQNSIDDAEGWVRTDYVRVCEYYRKVEKSDRLWLYRTPDGLRMEYLESELKEAPDLFRLVKDSPLSLSRPTSRVTIEYHFIIGTRVVESLIWPGKYIPIVPVIGEEIIIEGIMDRKGHTRALIDPQRMYNYFSALRLDTPLPTPEGWTTMGAVREGDWLIDEKGKPVQVIGTSPIYINHKCYAVRFDDGSQIVADATHKWAVEERGKRRAATWEWKKKVVTTAELEAKKHFIWATKPLELPRVDLPLDPYVLGAWLGDGFTSRPAISSGFDDMDEMQKNLAACGHNVGLPILHKDAAVIPIYNEVETFKNIGLIGNKHIPAIYLRASREQRLALLQGLMDTDGSISKKLNQCNFVNTNPRIIEGFAELLRSLGIKAVRCEKQAHMKMFPNGETYTSTNATQFSFTADIDVPIFRLERKRKLQQTYRIEHPRRTKRHRVMAVTEVASVPVKCVAVESESHLFLAGPGMVPTHNSSAVEYAALQSKSPYIAPAEAIEGYETYWNTANRVNHSVIPYRGVNDAGETIAAPVRQEPPVPAPVALQGMQTAAVEFQMASGQYEASMGQQGNERSANAIEKRERQGDTATYHFIDNMAISIRFVAKIVLDLMPHIYDTPRLLRMQGEDGVDFELELNPQAMQVHAKKVDHLGKVVGQILNPAVGLYEVQADVGPSWGSKREETFQALSLILTQAPQLVSIIGDLLMSSSDFDKANEAAARLRRMVPPQALGEGPSPEVMQLQAQITQLTGMLQKSLVTISEDRIKMKGHAEKRDIDVTGALTTRLKALLAYSAKTGMPVDPKAIDDLLHQTVRGEMANDASLGAIASVNREDLGDTGQGDATGPYSPGPLVNGKQIGDIPPIPGARRGNDGHWYTRNYSGSSQFSRVM